MSTSVPAWFVWAALSACFAALTAVFAKAGVRDIDAESRQGAKKPSHRYQLADYGLTEEEVGGLFEGL